MTDVVTPTETMQPHFRTFTVETEIPSELGRLRELAYNLWWSWHPAAIDLFARIDPHIWETTAHNPVGLLDATPAQRLAELAANDSFRRAYHEVIGEFDAYMDNEKRAEPLSNTKAVSWNRPVAYFSTEFGIHESLPLYSGGLGVLSGDHLKSASDLNVPLVGIGLCYRHGYFRQRLSPAGEQVAEYPRNDFASLPMRQVLDSDGLPVTIDVQFPGRKLYASVWRLNVGRGTLYLLDTDVPSNTAGDRNITAQLYVGDQRTRVEQEILLGVGGARLLRRLGITPSVYHLNEGHSAFLILQRLRETGYDARVVG